MKIYRNYSAGTGSIFTILFTIFIAAALLICIINDVKSNEYRFIKYYLITIVPVIYSIIILFNKFYGKIIFDKNKLYISKILYSQYIPFYNIIEIKKTYIMTIDKVIFLFPEDEKFWIELNKLYTTYCKTNKKYFCETGYLYEKIHAIMLELHEEEIEGNKKHVIKQLPVYIVYFIFVKKLINFCTKYTLYDEYFKNKNEIKKFIREYKDRPNFA